jgi:ABC-type glycerol-3-phosphate transport system substrate-binding protein
MKRRKFLALTAALVLAATTGLASCGNNSGSKGDTKELTMSLNLSLTALKKKQA